MLHNFRTLMFISVIFVTTALPVAAQITDVTSENKAVNDAMNKAKETLPQFFARLAKPKVGDSGFLIKIRFDKGKGDNSKEHIWAKDIVLDSTSTKVSATIDNDPRDLLNLKRFDRVTVPVTDISDWLYVREGKYQGAYTVRALLPFMTRDAAADMRKRLPD